jgi:general stress protein CsbA
MKKNASLIGILLVVACTLLLFAAYLLHYTTNYILIGGLVLIIAGIVGYVQGIKHSNGY